MQSVPGQVWIAADAHGREQGTQFFFGNVGRQDLRTRVLAGRDEIAQLGRTLWQRRADILAFFDHHASNGPTEAINGRLDALRRNALGFRNLSHYRWRSLLHSGALHAVVNAV